MINAELEQHAMQLVEFVDESMRDLAELSVVRHYRRADKSKRNGRNALKRQGLLHVSRSYLDSLRPLQTNQNLLGVDGTS